jgi:DNA polymerase-3 subunit alpha
MKQQFVHLHVHSEYSLLDGASNIEQMVREAKSQGMPALALTDHGNMYGTIPFYKACRAHDIKPIIGVEVYVTNQPLTEKMGKDRQDMYHLLLLAETNEGYRNLMQLTTKANLEGFYYKPRVTKEWLRAHHRGLICLSACLAGEVQQALLQSEYEQAKRVALEHAKIFGPEHYFLELQDHGMPEQKKVNAKLIRLAEETGIPLVVTNDVHYTYQRDAVAHDCLLCIGTGKKVKDELRLKFPSPEFYLKSEAEMRKLFPHLPQAYEQTVRIAERCHVEIEFGKEILPQYPVPQGKSAEQYLRELCEEGLLRRYQQVTAKLQERLDYELNVINQMGYADYFLIVWDFMQFAHRQGIVTGPGRGSAAGSLVAYVLQITNVDPIRYGLLFERFLNPERVTLPDIDIDFSDRRRDEVIRYVAQKYGTDRVAQIITFGTLGAKAAVRDVGRVLDISISTVNQLAKNIPSAPGTMLKQAVRDSAILQQMIEEDEKIKHLFQVAAELEGKARHTSTHAAGVVISREPLTHYVPLQQGHDDVSLTQYAMEDLEDIGLLKMDFLGLRNLTLIEEIVELINQHRDQEDPFKLEHIPLDDQRTFELLSTGDTTGVFQLESEGMRSVLKRLRPSTFEDVIAVLALYRPGPMDNIPLFIDAKHGRVEVEYPHEDLKPILQDTYGIIVYQEQIMQIASKMAGFTLGEADLLRRAVGKKKREILEQERDHFIQGCIKQGYEQDTAEHVYDLIVRFANYGFNRSHSAAYAVIAYQLAYLKANYPVFFLAALLSTSIGHAEKVAEYLAQARKRGIQVLPPSVVHSVADFSVQQNRIRIGLSVVKHVGHPAINEIVQERQKAPFRNLLDFCQRVSLKICNRRVIESLIMAGAFDDLDMHRAQALANLDDILSMAEQAQGLKQSDQLFFFADELPDDYAWIDVPPYEPFEQLKAEKETLGFYLSGHPLDPYRETAKLYQAYNLAELQTLQTGQSVRTIGSVIKCRQIKTKKGEPMAFALVEDQGVELELVIFPRVYKQKPTLFVEGSLLFVEGNLESKANEMEKQLIVHKAIEVSALQPKQNKRNGEVSVFIRLTPQAESSPHVLEELKRLLRTFSGSSPVYLYYESRKKTVLLSAEYHVQPAAEVLQKLKQLVGSEHVSVKAREKGKKPQD